MTIKNEDHGGNNGENQAQLVEAEIQLVDDEGNGRLDEELGESNNNSRQDPLHRHQEEEIVVDPEDSNNDDNDDRKRRAFPDAFYCPITKNIMKEPVVHPEDFNSYEKSAIIARDGDGLAYYPNRALQAYMEQELNRLESEGSMRGTLQRINESAKTGWQKLLDTTSLPLGEFRQLPDALYCPITCDLVYDPAVDPDGITYERSAIIQWLQVNGVSPNTRNPLRIDQLYDNNTLLQLLLEESEGEPEAIHPALKRWREEYTTRPPRPPDPEITVPSNTNNDTNGDPAHAGAGAGAPHPYYYPTTQAELNELRRRRRPMTFAMILATLLACVMFLFFPSYFIFFVFCACGLLWIRKTQMAEQHVMQERHREHLRAQHFMQQAQRREQQLRQEQQQQHPHGG